jgi:hypothetical protein
MQGSFFKGAVVGLVCAVLGGATVALAGSGIGGVFNLGQTNSVDAQTRLTGSAAGSEELLVQNTNSGSGSVGLRAIGASASAALKGENTSTGPGVAASSTSGIGVQAQSASPSSAALQAKNTGGGSAGNFVVNAGVAPLTVNSTTKVASLNADQLDGLDSSALQTRVTGTCAAGSAINVVNSDGSVACQATGGGGGIPPGSVGTTELAADAVIGSKVADGSLNGDDIQDNSLTSADIGPSAVGSSEIATDGVGATEIQDGSIDSGEIVDNSLFASDLAPGSVGSSELQADAVDSGKVANNSLTLADIQGINNTGSVSFSSGAVANGRCRDFALTTPGSKVGEAVLLSVRGAVAEGMLLYGVRVAVDDQTIMKLCNFTGGTSPTITNLPIRVATFS